MAALPTRLRGYARRLTEDYRVVVVVDRDADDCKELKARLENMAAEAGLATRSTATRDAVRVLPRIAVEELEAWYFGDWKAVRVAYPRVPRNVPSQRAFRNPDGIAGGTWEAFERVLQEAGYFSTGLRKIEAARAIAEDMDPSRNTSPSFCALRDVLREMISA